MVAVHTRAPQSPTGPIFAKQLVSDWQAFGFPRRPRGHGKHAQLRARSEKRGHFAAEHSADIWLMILVCLHGNLPSKVLQRADRRKAMIAAEIAACMPSNLLQQHAMLKLARSATVGQKTPQATAQPGQIDITSDHIFA